MKIKKAQMIDIEQLSKMYIKYAESHAKNIKNFYRPYSINKIKAWIKNTINVTQENFLLACEDNKIVGFVQYSEKRLCNHEEYLDKYYIEVENIFVDNDYQNRGIASLLLKYIDEISIQKCVDYIELKVYDFNKTATKCYLKNNYNNFCTYMRKHIKSQKD